MRDLRERVNACIRAPGSVQLEVARTGRGADRALDLALHRSRVLLDLPAAVARAGVLDREPETHPELVRPSYTTTQPVTQLLCGPHSLEHLSQLSKLLAVGCPIAALLCRHRALVVGLRFGGECRQTCAGARRW